MIEKKGDTPQHTFIKLPPPLYRALDHAAKQRFMSRTHYIRQALLQALQDDGIDVGSFRREGE
ncbi:ribbon-helix-helix protein, CopG family [Bradyrhizobium liaoningense]|uniref:ribbon-helix-helix domain-containing protein n=1 Tax=Bradyrhizobium liaoningense TaxID=43992 RepID=UPI001BA6929B|nr:CopG family transcriptional regulator [Bradyrhizobium liaoningense]MBR0741186.1 ribbon-helix-helix protein, CopG family [Bradyrhizobium liaoningense]